MQTKLRMPGLLFLTFVAGLLWTTALAAAPEAKARPVVAPKPKARKVIFGGKPQFVGIASWYGKQHQGLKMANGRPFDRRKLTAAAWNMPLGTVLHVVNLKNGKSVVVTVTDRGPHPRLKRVLDLSEAAAEKLGYVKEGLTPVFISRVPTGQLESAEINAQLSEPPADLEKKPAQEAVVAASL